MLSDSRPFSSLATDDDWTGTKMTGASSSSNPSQVQPPVTAVSPKNGEEAASVVRTSRPSISLLRPPIPMSEVWFLTYFLCSSCLLGRIRSIPSIDRAIVSDLTFRSKLNLQDECPIPCRTCRNLQIGIWRSWAPWARLIKCG
ncbi:hypothetical protein L3X38_032248 [Prunus dulcis]|uniref:Uncharacterized protein n=1 Tax=Prunus dulcis TaxID=3755 RepID=A0AAD4VFV8_PRUDU|nr:hypothetical protein L3X38_032248 [Prunus dulcis]